MKVGLSTWSLLGMDVCAAVRSIGDAGFEYIELWGEVPHAFHGWVDKRKLKDELSKYKFTVTMHAPFTDLNPANPFEPVRTAVQKTLRDFVEFAADLGASMVTIHPGSVHSRMMVPEMEHSSVTFMKELVSESRGRLSISIENQTSSRSKYHFPLASTVESLEILLAEVDGSRFTLDTGHAYASGIPPSALAERCIDRLAEVHLSDNEGGSDDHLIPGEGTADLRSVLGMVSGRDVLICLELDPHRYTEEQVLKAAAAQKELLGRSSSR
jgi:sugar phosphate isomerase/epimerase